MAKAIEAKNIFFSYHKGVLVLQDVSFDIVEGEYAVILGHNGSGKSTLARIIRGLLDDYEGKVILFGKENPTREENSQINSQIGMVFQNPDNQFVGSTVEDDVAFGLENRQVPLEEMKAKVQEALEEVGMWDNREKAPENLSGGQKQRVALAGVMAMSPSLLILDEATSMVDPKGKRDIYKTLHALRKRSEGKLTLLSITHDVEEALSADKIIVLKQGQIVRIGKPEEIFSDTALLEECSLEAPFAYEFKQALKKEGIELDCPHYSLEEIAEELCRK